MITKKILCFILIIVLMMCACSCGEERSAYEIILEFRAEYGELGTVYSLGIPEGETGHCDISMYEAMLGENSDSCKDFATILSANPEKIAECTVLIAYSEYDAMLLSERCFARLDLLASLPIPLDASCLEDAFVIRRGKVVVLCAMPNNALAAKIFKKIL